ncbi:hypothetical protein Bca52824_031459 [Brassica carinata]|uniref:Uncharacterized protein n=1 Tax=Brassica carinata TaxID=52824 RepID=A0A8X7SB01_BRACI|nr:hypothetical protein Bca52824_031459 [Brassica carinata]
MNKRLVKIKACQVILKRRCKRMKAMEKKLGKIEKEMKAIKEKEKEKDNYEGFDYQGMDYEWDGQRNDINADMVEPEGQKIDEKESEEEPEVEAEEAEKDDIGGRTRGEAKEMVEDEVEEPEKEAVKYTEEEKQEWYMVVYETKEADEGAAKPAGTEGAPKRRGRPRKATEPKKFTTPEPTKRIRSRSRGFPLSIGWHR